MRRLFVLLLLAFTSTCLNTGSFLQITDVHYDSRYTPGAPNNCLLGITGLGCCRKNSIPLDPYGPAGEFGDYNCDVPLRFIESSFDWIRNNLDNPDFILWTGDNVDHHDLSQSLISNIEEIAVVSNMFSKYFSAPVYPILGNHDTFPIDQLTTKFSETVLSKNVTDIWQRLGWLDTHMAKQFRYGGYYNTSLRGVQIIALNSLYYDKNNLEIYIEHEKDPVQQWQWLEATLQWCKDSKLKAWLIGHIPAASGEATNNFTNNFSEIVNKYSDVLVNQFWGHTHNDQFMLYMNKETKTATAHGYIAPSMMARSGAAQFPTIRQYIYNRDTMEVMDYKQYFCNLTDANVKKQVNYMVSYSAKDAYNMPDLSTDSWAWVYKEMNVNKSMLLDYWSRYIPGLYYPCDDLCQEFLLHEIVLDVNLNKKMSHTTQSY
jgi:predicted MPP superfamily phosphohydrolase